jgi:hypothetical protein
MSFEPNPKQALLLWNMITGATPEERRPMMSEAKPEITPKDRKALVDQGLLSQAIGKSKKGARASFLDLTDKAWAWAGHARDVEISASPAAQLALQGLLRRLIPFLEQHDFALADLFRDGEVARHETSAVPIAPTPPAATFAKDSVRARVEHTCLSLAGGAKKSRVRLSALRKALPAISRQQLDTALIELQREQRLVLFREDNTPALTPEDHAAALLVGDSPRHLIYLEA